MYISIQNIGSKDSYSTVLFIKEELTECLRPNGTTSSN